MSLAFCEPYRYADAYSLVRRAPLIVCLDQVTDPHNLGAVVRSAEGAGASGVVITERNSARVTPAVSQGLRGCVASTSPSPRRQPLRYLEEIKGPQLWIWATPEDAETPVWSADLTTGVALVLGAEGRGFARESGVSATTRSRCRSVGSIESLNVSVAAGIALFEAARQRRGA